MEQDIVERLFASDEASALTNEAAREIERLRALLPFSQLTPGEAERLAMLAEECGEVVQVVGKILRHGYKSCHPKDPTTTNRQLLERELMDLTVVEGMLNRNSDVDMWAGDSREAVERKLRYTHHQEDPK